MNLNTLKAHKTDILKIGILAILVLVLYSPTFQMFWYDWSHDDNYSHGFLVPFIVGYLVWTKRDTLRTLTPRPSLWGLPVLAAGLLIYIVGTIGAEWFVRRSSLIIVLAGLILYLYGAAYFKTLLFPLVFLIFMVPLPAIIYKAVAFKLQLFVSIISAWLIKLIGIPVFLNGNIIEVSTGPLAVEEACSGMRSIMALLALSALFGYIMYNHSKWRQWLMVAAALPIAVLTNIIRVTSTAVLAHFFGRQMAEGVLHESFGGLVFLIALAFLFLLSKLLDWLAPYHGAKPQKPANA